MTAQRGLGPELRTRAVLALGLVRTQRRLGPELRTRAVLALGLVLLVIGIAWAASRSGSGDQGPPPATGAAAVVPADALAYVHLSIDPSRLGVKRALAVAARMPGLPSLAATLAARLGALGRGGDTIDFARDVQPWLGKEAALALLDTSTSTAGALIVLDVSDRPRATAFLLKSGATGFGSYRGVPLYTRSPSTELAFVSHYLVIGQAASVHAAIDVAAGGAPSLEHDPTYERAAAGEPDGRVLDAYASAAGVRRVLASQGGLAGALGALLYQPALSGVTASVSAAAPGLRITIHSALEPSLAGLGSSARTFTPTLEGQLPAGSLLALDTDGLDRLAPKVLSAGTTGGLAGGVGTLLARLGAALSSEGVNVSQLRSLFDGEAAFAIAPGLGPGGSATSPGLIIVARVPDEQRAQTLLASAELPLALLVRAPNTAQTPAWSDRTVGGVTAHQLSLPGRPEIDYAVFRGLVVISTSLDGIAAVAAGRATLSSSGSYRLALADRPSRVTSLLFLDFSQLLKLGEQTGLIGGARFTQLRGALQTIRAVGLVSTGGEADSTAELSLQIP
jgi:hypothetical protein